MPPNGKIRAILIVTMALVCLGFVAMVGLTATIAAADDRPGDGDKRTDYENDAEERRTHVEAHLDTEQLRVTVDEETDRAAHARVEAVEGEYDHAGRYRIEPGESLTLPTPGDEVVLRVTAETADGGTDLAVTVTYERYELECDDVRHGAVVPTEVTSEYRTTVDGEERRWSRTATMPGVDCPARPGDDPGHEEPDRPERPERPDRPGDADPDAPDPEDSYETVRRTAHEAYDEGNETAGDGYEDGREAVWETYEQAHDQLWSGYEDANEAVWGVYDTVVDGDGDDEDPGETVNETVEDATAFGERVVDDTRDDADRVREDAERTGERVREDAEDDAERVRDDAEDDAERVGEYAEDGAERVQDDVERKVNETIPDDGDGGDNGETVWADGSAAVERNGSTVTARGAAEAGASAGGHSGSVDQEAAVTADLRP